MLNSYLYQDCLPAMKLMPDNAYEIGVVDPNYGIGESNKNHNSRNTPIKQKNGNILTVSDKNYHRSDWDKVRPSKEYFIELFRVCKYVIIWGGNYFTDLLSEHCSGRIIWDKCNGNSDFSDCEIAYTNLFKSTRLFRFMWNGMMQGKSILNGHIQQGNKSLNEKRIHPTQKPVALYKWIAHNFIEQNWKVLDTHVGSASSLIAYEDYEIEYKGFENNLIHYTDSNTRLTLYKSKYKLKFN